MISTHHLNGGTARGMQIETQLLTVFMGVRNYNRLLEDSERKIERISEAGCITIHAIDSARRQAGWDHCLKYISIQTGIRQDESYPTTIYYSNIR